MRRTITAVAAAAALALATASPAVAKGKPAFAGPGLDTTIVETAVALSGDPFDFDSTGDDFDILVAAVVATGATAVLDGETDYTVFAPTDDAFTSLVAGIAGGPVTEEEAFDALVAVLGVEGVLDVLAYHITEDWRPSPSVVNVPSIMMLDGNQIFPDGTTIDAIGSTASIIQPDVKTADGGIHVIDTVLLPF